MIDDKKLLLIHGYGQSYLKSLLGRFGLNITLKSYSFKAFRQLIEKGNAKVFVWHHEIESEIFQYFNPFYVYKNLYITEKEKSVSTDIQKQLTFELQSQKPEIIVCHSLGCYLLLNYLDKYNLPASVKKIFLVQGDFSTNYSLTNPDLIKKLENKELEIINCYCPWDPILHISKLTSVSYRPAGVYGFKNELVTNKLFPLYKAINLHNSSIEDKNLVKFINASMQ
jgi:hypothetical protein